MWRKHKKEFVFSLLMIIGIILVLLLMVYGFERLKIHVPGSRDMWMGVIGAIVGGTFTLYGVMITIYSQEEVNIEQKRIENMPIIGFHISLSNRNGQNPLYNIGIIDDEVVTCGFPVDDEIYSLLEIYVSNKKPVFKFTVVDVFVNDRGILKKTKAFGAVDVRIVGSEKIQIRIFFVDHILDNKFVVMRSSYEDILGNKYMQDIPFTVIERTCNKCTEQIFEIRDIRQPAYVDDVKPLPLKDIQIFADYRAFVR